MLFVISAPSGAGKTTIIKELFNIMPGLKFSVSATTRKKREGELDGKDYYFISKEEFKKLAESGDFVEYEEVFDNHYGTLKSEVEPYLESNQNLIFDIDVKGALSIKNKYPEAVSIFIDVPIDEIVRRLKKRMTESDEEIEKRMSRIKLEIEQKNKFDFIVDNSGGIDKATEEIKKIINNINRK